MLTLYQIEKHYLEALEMFTDPDTEIQPGIVADTLEAIEGEFEVKAIRVAAFARQMEMEADAIKQVETQMEKRRKSLEAKARWLKEYVKSGMEIMGRKKIESTWFVLSVAKNPAAVEVFEEAEIPQEFKHQEVLTKIDKAAIKLAIEAKREVPGARLVNGTRLAIRG